jgi:hypothetical protein
MLRSRAMAGPIPSLVAARLRRRGATAAVSVAAVAAAAALIAVVAGIGLIAADATVARALSMTGADRPVVRISQFSSSDRGLADTMAAVERSTSSHLGQVGGPVVRGLLSRELLDLEAPVFELVVAVDDPAAWLLLSEGRAPAPCRDATRCEAVLLSEVAPGFDFDVARPADGLTLDIVGRGLLDPAVPFGDLDQRGPFGARPAGADYQTGRESPAVLLVDGVDALARATALTRTGRTYVWAAPIDVATIHPWTADRAHAAIGSLSRELGAIDPAFTVTSPMAVVDAALDRADAARGRLLLIGSLGVAILLAFAVFLALVVRDDVAAEVGRLRSLGARRRDRSAFLVVEALVPTGVGAVLGWAAGAVIVAGLAAWAGSDVAEVVSGALLDPTALTAGLLVMLAVVMATVLAYAPGAPRSRLVPAVVVAAATAIGILGWQLATSGPLGPDQLAGALATPVVVLLPPAIAFAAALLLAAAMPPFLRALGRRLRAAPLHVRLSLLSLARDPGRPAATITLLAFSLGAIVFAAAWSASLRAGIEDAAAYRSGLDLRVSELGTGLSISRSVVPTDRYRALGADVTAIPVYRETSATQPGGAVEILGIDPRRLTTLPGWRADFSAVPVRELADRLEVPAPAGGWAVAGHPLPAGDDRLTLRFRYEGDPLRLDAVVRTVGGDAATVRLGTIRDGMTEAIGRLPQSAIGGTLTTLTFATDQLIAGDKHQGEVIRATVAFEGLDGLVDDRRIDLEVFANAAVTIGAPQATDGLRLPVVVSPDLARDATADGALDLHLGSGLVPARVVGVAERAPTIVDTRPRFAIVSLDPFLIALASAVPAAGRPSEMWITAPTAERLDDVREVLADRPFRFAEVTARSDLVAERAGDPLSQAIVWALVAAALAGLVLSVGGLVMGAITDLRDERGELADLEAQGVPPSALRWHALTRTAILAIGGALAGLMAGIALAYLAIGTLAIDAEGRLPIPPLSVVLPPLPILSIVGIVLVIVLGTVAWLARRTYGRATLGERRVRRRAAGTSTVWSTTGSETGDG